VPDWYLSESCERCGDADGRPVMIDGVTVHLCETCDAFVRSGRRGGGGIDG
jgi:hypothetical protein